MTETYILKEYQLHLTSPFITPWHSDILFGHLAWAYRERFGEEKLSKWLDEFKSRRPPYVFSNGLMKGQFPRPFLPPKERKITNKSDRIHSIKAAKKIKRKRFIHTEDFLAFIQGELQDLSTEEMPSIQTSSSLHSTVSRVTGSAIEFDGIHEEEVRYLPKNYPTITLFVRCRDEASEKELSELLKQVSYQGFGKKKSVGYGQFDFNPTDDIFPCEELENNPNANAVIWLSHGVPARDDPQQGWYKLESKYGKLAGFMSQDDHFNKKPLTRLVPGSVFVTDQPKAFYGRMVSHIYSGDPAVVQYGYALAIPIKLPDNLNLSSYS